MSGRRSHSRFAMSPAPEGVFRVLKDVVLRSATREDMIVISRDPGVLGEVVAVESSDEAQGRAMKRVLESQLIVVDGAIRHQLRLEQFSE